MFSNYCYFVLIEKYKFVYTVKPASNGLDIVQTFYNINGDILEWNRNLMKRIVDNQNFTIFISETNVNSNVWTFNVLPRNTISA